MEQEIINKMKLECQLGSSTQLYPNQILALANAIINAAAANSLDCYPILLAPPGPELLTRLKTLMQILDPAKNKLVFSEEPFKVVCDAWFVLSDLLKKSQDEEDASFVQNEQNKKEEEERVSVCTENEQKKTFFDEKDNALKKKEKDSQESGKKETFWTVCPYCYYMYEYEKWYEECCLRCQNCRRAFHGVAVAEPKSDILVKGRDEYFCGVGGFPLKYSEYGTINAPAAGGGGMCKSHRVDAVIVISDSDDDGKSMCVNNDARKFDKVKAEVVKGNVKSGEEGCLSVMQGSGKTEERNGEKRRVHVKSVGRKSKVKGRPMKSRRIESMNKPGAEGLDLNVKFGEGFRGDGHEMEIGSGSGNGNGIGDGDGCLDNDLEFSEKDGDVFVGFKFDG